MPRECKNSSKIIKKKYIYIETCEKFKKHIRNILLIFSYDEAVNVHTNSTSKSKSSLQLNCAETSAGTKST